MTTYDTRYVRYHSYEWMILVETGWITATVDAGIARMLREVRS